MKRLAYAAAAATLMAAAPVGERVITDTSFATTVASRSVRLLVDPGAPAMPILSQPVAEAAGLKAGPFGIGFRVGPVMVWGRSAVGQIDLGQGPQKRRIGWTERPFRPGYDGAVGPGGLPDPVVRFRLRDAVPGERTVALPLIEEGGLFGSWGASGTTIALNGQPMQVRFTLDRDETLATAGAALALVQALGGTLDQDRAEAELVFGVKRPVRTLHLKRPLTIGPIALSTLSARTGDFGNAEGIAATGVAPDPDEIVVTAKGKRDRRRDRITLGRGALSRCSSIVFDKPARQIRLTCA